MDDQKRTITKQIILQPNMAEELLTIQPHRERQRSRSLGLLETMYHTYNSREVDVCPLYFHFNFKFPVKIWHIKEALFRLVVEFPGLRLTIVQTGHHEYKFVEKRNLPIPFSETCFTSVTELLEQQCHHQFDFSHGPLWKFTWLKGSSDTRNKTGMTYGFHFLFTFHHAISDFYVTRIIIRSFIRNIVASQGALPATLSIERKLYPPIDNLIPLDLISTKQRPFTQWSTNALDIYNLTFCDEIGMLSKENPVTNIQTFQLNTMNTKTFFKQCKQHQVKVTSAIVAGFAISFTNLVRKAIPKNCNTFSIPIEIVVDLRHFIDSKNMHESFTSVGSIQLPFLVEINLAENINSTRYYWSLAADCQKKLNKLMTEGEPMQVLLQDVPLEIRQLPEKGKSPFVITLTNLGDLTDINPPECANEVKLNDFYPWTNVSSDDMPIFYTAIQTLNDSLTIVIGSCRGYTSQQTTNVFTACILNILHSCSSKL